MNKKPILKVSSLLSVGAISLATLVACGSTSQPFNKEDNIFSVSHFGKELDGTKIKFKDVLQKLKDTNTQNAKQVSNIFNAAVKFLYVEEQKASVKEKDIREKWIKYQNPGMESSKLAKKIKDANIKALSSEADIRKKIKAKFLDSKEAFKESVGPKWGEEAWGAELSKSYDGARNDAEAIEGLLIKEMKANAYLRYTLTKLTTKYTKEQLELGTLTASELDKLKKSKDARDKLKVEFASYYSFLKLLKDQGLITSSNKNKTLSQLNSGDYITVISTNSHITNFKSTNEVIGKVGGNGYINKFDPMFISHFLIKAVPDAKNRLSPWKISMDDLKKILRSFDGQSGMSQSLKDFIGVQKISGKWTVNKNDKKVLELVAGNSGSKTNGGSLKLQDELEYVQGMVPGFSIPILNKGANTLFDENSRNPIDGLTLTLIGVLEKLNGETPSSSNSEVQQRAGISGGASVENADKWHDYIEGLISTQDQAVVLSAIGRKFKDIFGDSKKYRSILYNGANNKIVLSKFGIHIIKINRVAKANAADEIKGMIFSDAERSKDGKMPFFDAIKEINKYSSDQHLVVEGLMKSSKFIEFLKTQKNFSATPVNNVFPNYDVKKGSKDLVNIQKALDSHKQIFNETRAFNAIKDKRTFIQDTLFKNEILKSSKWVESINNIYDNALTIANEGLVK